MSDEDQQEQPRGLRALADEINRKHRDPDHTPIGELTGKEDRRLDLNDDHALNDIQPPRFRNLREAAEYRANQRKEAEEQYHEQAEQSVKDQERQWTDAVNYRTGWNDPAEIDAVNQFNEVHQWNGQARAQFKTLLKSREDHVRSLNEAGKFQEAQAWARHHLTELVEIAKPIDQTDQWLQQRTQQGIAHQRQKELAYGQAQLARTVGREIFDPQVKERFFYWAEATRAIPRWNIKTETNPGLIAQLFKEFTEYERQQYESIARKRVANSAMTSNGPGSSTSSKDAREQLRKRGGKMSDALNYLHLRRQERRHGI